MCCDFKERRTLHAFIACFSYPYLISFDLDNSFMAYTFYVSFLITLNTFPKLPNPIYSIFVKASISMEAIDVCLERGGCSSSSQSETGGSTSLNERSIGGAVGSGSVLRSELRTKLEAPGF